MGAYETIEKTIKKHRLLKKGDVVVVGFSGGPDSVCLLHCLWRLSREERMGAEGENPSWSLHAVHVNHQLRPGAADADESYALGFCRERGIPFTAYHFDIGGIAAERGLSTEDAGRRARYGAFEEVRRSICARAEPESGAGSLIAVAQNANDQAETVLMRLMRGTGLTGLSAMDYSRGDGIIRPLLDVSREEVEAYCEEQGLKPCMDHTNLETDYTRNRIRLELLPYMKKNFNQNIIETLNRLAAIAREDSSFIDDEAEGLLEAEIGPPSEKVGKRALSLPLSLLKDSPPALRHRMIFHVFGRLGLEQNISAVHLEQADHVVFSGTCSAVVEFPRGYRMRLVYDSVVFEKADEVKKKAGAPQFRLEVTWMRPGEKDTDVKPERTDMSRRLLDGKAVKDSGFEPVLRTRRAGDYIRPLGMKGTKKLQNFFVDKKIPKEKRELVLLVCLGSEVIWVAGTPEILEGEEAEERRKFGVIGEAYKVRPESGQALLLQILSPE